MTRLQQITFNNLKEMLIAGEMLLVELEKALKDLEPQHEWEHGDVFRNSEDVPMVYIKLAGRRRQIFCLGSCTGHDESETVPYLTGAKFLFNIREKL